MDDRRIHDYRQRYWGHDFTIQPHADPVTASVTGWGAGVRKGDLLLLPNGDGACFYEIESIQRPGEPGDMWFTECRFVPASSELGQKARAAMDGIPKSSPFGLTSWRTFDA